MMLHQQSRYAEGIKEAQRLIKSFPGEMMLFNILGVCLEQEGAFQKAADAYKQALSINPAIPELQFNLGAMLYALSEPKKAIHHYEEAIRLNPNFTEAYFNLGTLYQSQSEYSQAINAYEKALTIQPGFYEALANIGTIKQLQGRLDEAIEILYDGVAQFEDNPLLQLILSGYLFATAAYDEGKEILTNCLKLEPTSIELFHEYFPAFGRIPEITSILAEIQSADDA